MHKDPNPVKKGGSPGGWPGASLGLKCVSKRPKVSKMAPKWLQNGPKWPQNGPKWPKMVQKWPQNGPKWPQKWPKMENFVFFEVLGALRPPNSAKLFLGQPHYSALRGKKKKSAKLFFSTANGSKSPPNHVLSKSKLKKIDF